MSHPGLLAMVVPGNDVDHESKLAGTALKTLHNYLPKRTIRKSFTDRISSACDLTWPWLLAVAGRLQDREYAGHILMDIAISEFLKSNGMFAFIGGGQFKSVEAKRKAYDGKGLIALHALFALSATGRGREETMSMLQHPSGFLFAVNEMLLQSYGGCIKIFPSVPDCLGKNCSFSRLLAEGGFEVSAEMQNGKTVHVKIKSLCGGRCRLKIHNPKQKSFRIESSRGKLIDAEKCAGGAWEFDTLKGQTYSWGTETKKGVSGRKTGKVEVKKYVDVRGDVITYGKRGHIYER
ncbi:MAG: hypothetical protein NT118_12765 [Lentisphaerae bacterium]|nr:hypothetical protein [Lentisphaerota bacterium]